LSAERPFGAAEAGAASSEVPLCVDLDGTLLRTDSLMEAILLLMRRGPGFVAMMLLWLCRGRAVLKDEVAHRVALDTDTLPLNTEFLDWLAHERAGGRRLVLCTGASRLYGEAVAERLGIFDEVLASERDSNLSGTAKAAKLTAEYGERGFDYAGNSVRDLSVWRRARHAIVVTPSLPLALQSGRVPRVAKRFPRRESRVRAWLRGARVHHWLKNALVFVPAIAAQALWDPQVFMQCVVAFLAFSLAASGIYVHNDLLDLRADRAHPAKRKRPFASGELQAAEGMVGSVALVAAGIILGYAWLGPLFVAVLVAYIAGTVAYSFGIKRRPVVDILWLAGLYTGRILAGSAATHIEPSFWLLAFSMFLFLSLAAAKRAAELVGLEARSELHAPGRGYSVSDLPLLLAFGVAAAYTSVLVLALYLFSRADDLYARPQLLWLLCPALLYWVSRIWLKAHRRKLHEDPLVFAFTDPPSIVVGILSVILVWLAS
jgi:4-hydroxybenzoate polyprenyltransferase/phosphoserine phosphatase